MGKYREPVMDIILLEIDAVPITLASLEKENTNEQEPEFGFDW